MTISAKIIADSISKTTGVRIITFELEYPRFIHAEFMTHRMLSRNAASSRAIPIAEAIRLIIENPAMPIHWGKNQPGMSAKEECNALIPANDLPVPSEELECVGQISREKAWLRARNLIITCVRAFAKAGYHKQIINRLLEPWSHIKVVVTATEWDNFYALRRHPDAQPEIQQLAEVMWQAQKASTPQPLGLMDWHLPYYGNGFWSPSLEGEQFDLPEAIAISASCCAQVSYRTADDSLEKALRIYERLVNGSVVHASPFEHQATPFPPNPQPVHLSGVTSWSFDGDSFVQWSGNLREWCQNRQLIKGHVCNKYEPTE